MTTINRDLDRIIIQDTIRRIVDVGSPRVELVAGVRAVNGDIGPDVSLLLASLLDVPAPPAGSRALQSNSANDGFEWVVPGVGSVTSNDLTDFDTTSAAITHAFIHDGSSFKNRQLTLADLVGVPAPVDGAEDGYILKHLSGGNLFDWVEDTGGGGAVDSVFGRIGAVVAVADDYAIADITGLTAALAGKLALTGGNLTGNVTTDALVTIDGRDLSVDGAKLDLIEPNATADQTGAQIKTAYEVELKAFTDTQFDKLALIEASANNYTHPAEHLLSDIEDITQTRIMGRQTGSDGVMEQLTATQAKAILAIASGDVSGLGSLATLSAVGSTEITDGSVTAADMEDIAAATLLGHAGDSGDAAASREVLTPASLSEELTPAAGDFLVGWDSSNNLRKFDIGDLPTGGGGEINEGTNLGAGQGLYSGSPGLNLEFFTLGGQSGVLSVAAPASDIVNLSIDAGGIGTTQLADEGVTNAKLSHMAASTVKGQIVGGSLDPVDLSVAQLIAIINTGTLLDADTLDGEEGTAFHDAGNLTGTLDVARLAANTVTLDKLVNMGANGFLGTDGGGGAVETMTPAEAWTILAGDAASTLGGIFDVDVTGLGGGYAIVRNTLNTAWEVQPSLPTNLTAVAQWDLLIADASGDMENLGLLDLTALGATADAADLFMVWDASTTSLKSVRGDQLPGGGGGYTDPLTTQGDVVFRDASATTRLAAGTDTHVLKTGGPSANPSWAQVAFSELSGSLANSQVPTNTLAVNKLANIVTASPGALLGAAAAGPVVEMDRAAVLTLLGIPTPTDGSLVATGGTLTWEDHVPVLIEVHSASALSKGDAVYISGTHAGGKPLISLADSDGSGTHPAIGLVHADIGVGADGLVITGGLLTNFDTSTWTAGDALYLDTTAGALTSTRPTASATKVQKLGVVARSHASAGSVVIIGAGRTNDVPNELTDLTGVALGATDLGTFTGTTIADSQDIKEALQALETATEARLPLSGGTLTGNLDLGANNLLTSGTVDGVDISAVLTGLTANSLFGSVGGGAAGELTAAQAWGILDGSTDVLPYAALSFYNPGAGNEAPGVLGRDTANDGALSILTALPSEMLVEADLVTVLNTGSGPNAATLNSQTSAWHLDRDNHTGKEALADITTTAGNVTPFLLGNTTVNLFPEELTTIPAGLYGDGAGANAIPLTSIADITTASPGALLGASAPGTVVEMNQAAVRTLIGASDGGGLEADLLDGQHETAFALLAGRATPQTLNGSTGASGDLTLSSTANATKGRILFGGTDNHFDEDLGQWHLGGSTTNLDTIDLLGSMLIEHTAAEADDHALELDVDAAGFGDVKAIDIDYITGALAAGEDEAVILVNIDAVASSGGDVTALEVLATKSAATINGMIAGGLVNPIEQISGSFADASSVLVELVDQTTALSTGGAGNITTFVADNDTVTVGSASAFNEIEFDVDTPASNPGIASTFEYSTGASTWQTFTPVDGTNAMRNTGVVAWLDADVASPAWVTNATGRYEIRVTRTRNTLGTSPILDKVQVLAGTRYFWDETGAISAKSLTLTDDIPLAALPDMSINGFLGRNIGAPGAVEEMTVAEVKLLLGYDLGGMSDVKSTLAPGDGDVLTYVLGNNRWEALPGLPFDDAGVAANDFFAYNPTNGVWQAYAIEANGDTITVTHEPDNDPVSGGNTGRMLIEVTDATIGTAQLEDGGVTNAKLGPDAVTGAKIGDNEVDSEHIAADAVDYEHISANLHGTSPPTSPTPVDGQIYYNTDEGLGNLEGWYHYVSADSEWVSADTVKYQFHWNGSLTADNYLMVWYNKSGSANVGHLVAGKYKICQIAMAWQGVTELDDIDLEFHMDGTIEATHTINMASSNDKYVAVGDLGYIDGSSSGQSFALYWNEGVNEETVTHLTVDVFLRRVV